MKVVEVSFVVVYVYIVWEVKGEERTVLKYIGIGIGNP